MYGSVGGSSGWVGETLPTNRSALALTPLSLSLCRSNPSQGVLLVYRFAGWGLIVRYLMEIDRIRLAARLIWLDQVAISL